MTTAVDLDALLNSYTSFLDQGGNNLLTNPFFAKILPKFIPQKKTKKMDGSKKKGTVLFFLEQIKQKK